METRDRGLSESCVTVVVELKMREEFLTPCQSKNNGEDDLSGGDAEEVWQGYF